MQVLRDGEFSHGSKRDLAQGMVKDALDQVAAIFVANQRSCPFKEGKELDYKLDLLLKGYHAADSSEQQEVAITSF